MGVFDFLYKAPNRSNPRKGRPRGYGPPGSTPGYRPRTVIHVDRQTSLPLDERFSDHHYGGGYPQRSYRNVSSRTTPHNKNNHSTGGASTQPRPAHTKPAFDSVDSTKLVQNDDDDYTRLKRLENQIDSHITRHNECAEEMDSIRKTLNSIHKEFAPEFQEELSGCMNNNNKKNKHVVEVGERILAKLESMNEWQPNPITITVRTPPTPLKMIHQKKKDKTMDTIPEHSEINHHEEPPKPDPNDSKFDSPEQDFRPAFTSYMNQYESNTSENELPTNPATLSLSQKMNQEPSSAGTFTIARAHYALVNNPTSSYRTFTPTVTNTLSRHPTRPSLVEQQYGLPKTSSPYPATMRSPPPPPPPPPPPAPPAMMTVDDTFANGAQYSPVIRNERNFSSGLPSPPPPPVPQTTSLQQTPLYLNMAQSIHSEHPQIENCLRQIQLLRPRIKHYKSQHRMGVYKQFNEEIITLMHQMERLDCSKDELFEQDKQIALTELHNLSGMLERAIDCQDHDCDVCNSFINCKPEIAV